ncbi:MAG: AMP-binding protein, partial [Bdellovibrionota bacterium]
MTNSGSNIFGFFGAGLAKSELLIRPLILDGNQVSFTYGDLDFQSARIANVLKNSGCKRGDRVAVVTEKCIEFLALYAACLRIGAIFLPLNPSYTTHEIEYFLVDSKPHTFVVDPIREIELGEIARKVNVAQTWTLATKTGSLLIAAATQSSEFETRSVSGDEIAALLYTSGTTGRSKAAMLSHENLSSNALALISHWNFSASDILIHSLPVFHTHG